MKAKKLIRYRLSISRTFPSIHPRKGEETFFVEKILKALRILAKTYRTKQRLNINISDSKIHTIRCNYESWAKRFEKINKGEAVLELYYWAGKPYGKGVDQVTICQLGKEDGIGMQKLEFSASGLIGMIKIDEDFPDISITDIDKNDGLSLEDFKAWFKGYDLSKPIAIIHFTPFRY